MAKIGRNAPCPCGSGRKFKKCCLARQKGLQGYTAEDRISILQKLGIFVDDPFWENEAQTALDIFWGNYREAVGDVEDDYLHSMSEVVFDFWFAFDLRFEDDRLLIDYFLDTRPPLSAGERRYLEQARGTSMRLYEATQVLPETSITLRDLISGNVVEVRERSGSRTVKRWDILAARVMPTGASGWPEIDGGILLLPRLSREKIVESLKELMQDFKGENPDSNEIDFYKEIPPFFHQSWLQPQIDPQLPRLETTDGQEIVFCRVCFDVMDKDKLAAVLDSQKDLEREGEQLNWSWLSTSKDGRRVICGWFQIDDKRLILETKSKERAAKGKVKIGRIAKNLALYRLTRYTSPQQMPADLKTKGLPEKPDGLPLPMAEEMAEAIAEENKRYFREWLDMQIPLLDGHTPREAAGSSALKPRLIEMLKDMEYQYEKALDRQEPGFDPSWIWIELGLDQAEAAPQSFTHPPLTGYESMERQIPGISDIAREIGTRYRGRPDFDDMTTLTYRELEKDLTYQRFIRAEAKKALHSGMDAQDAVDHGNLIAAHLEYMSNHELHLKKTFWVDESLVWMLAQTKLDLSGDMLRLPFASFALIFTDRYILELAERLLSNTSDCELRGRKLKIMTVYVTQIMNEKSRGLRIAFTFDALSGQWPHLLVRDLKVDPDIHLEGIINSHFPDVGLKTLDPIFSSKTLKRLVHLVINAVLYITSADVETETRPSPAKAGARRSGSKRQREDAPYLSVQEVIYLPGKINISRLMQMQQMERAPGGRKLMVRFMVRGHWRRPNPSWKDQRPRWIKPYWKGPDLATVIERQYKLNP